MIISNTSTVALVGRKVAPLCLPIQILSHIARSYRPVSARGDEVHAKASCYVFNFTNVIPVRPASIHCALKYSSQS